MQRTATAAWIVLAAGCGTGATGFVGADGPGPEAHAVASLSRKAAAPEVEWSPRAGVILYMGAEIEVDPRPTIGGYARMLQTEFQRVELSLEITPHVGPSDAENLYFSFAGDYVLFVGASGLCIRGGGGGILEVRGEDRFFLGLIEGGAGFRLGVGRRHALLTAAMLQFPLGDVNVPVMLSITAGLEF